MKAYTYQKGNPNPILVKKEKPTIIKPTDAIVKMMATTICGTDLHILKGDVPEFPDYQTLGHEGIGIIKEVGSAVSKYQVGDKVIISCITSCGQCEFCQKGFFSKCLDGGWVLGHTIDGTQAEYVRIPHADFSLYPLPNQDNKYTLLSDIFPTGYEMGVLNARIKKGDTVAIVGSGPIGLAALLTSKFYEPKSIIMIDPNKQRTDFALTTIGASHAVNKTGQEAVDEVMKITNNQGCDAVIEAVGIPETFDVVQNIVKPTGTMAIAGVFGEPVKFNLEKLWIENIALRTGLVNTNTTKKLLKQVADNQLRADLLITHTFKFSEFDKAYDVFKNASANQALKVIIEAE